MDHICKINKDENEKLRSGTKTMIIRGGAIRKIPYKKVFIGDIVYFTHNGHRGRIYLKASVLNVINESKLTNKKATSLVDANQLKLQLNVHQYKKWTHKKNIVLIEFDAITIIEPIIIDKPWLRSMKKWIPVGNIESVIVNYETQS